MKFRQVRNLKMTVPFNKFKPIELPFNFLLFIPNGTDLCNDVRNFLMIQCQQAF